MTDKDLMKIWGMTVTAAKEGRITCEGTSFRSEAPISDVKGDVLLMRILEDNLYYLALTSNRRIIFKRRSGEGFDFLWELYE